MSLNESQICHEVNDSLKEFNKLIEQSEKSANRFYEQMENFNSIKTSESGNKIETSGSTKQKESNFPVGEDIQSNIIREIKLKNIDRNTKIISRSSNETKSDINTSIEFEKPKCSMETESDADEIQDLRPSNLIKFFESKNSIRQDTRKIKSTNEYKSKIQSILEKSRNEIKSEVNTKEDIKESKLFRHSDAEVDLAQEIRISNLIKVFDSNIDVIQETEIIKSRDGTKSIFEEYKEKNNKLNEKCKHLEDKLSRENCQIFIYGQVSVGKSKIINAILGNEIFQSTVAHTTSCFVKICKSFDQYHHIEYRNEKYRYDKLDDLKKEIKEMSTVFSNDQNPLETKELLSVYLNISDNKILTLNTEIIDCPGSANKESITNYLKDKALNAHIFIFVLNNGITDEDKRFFQYQLEQSSSPTIFMLVNKWDLAYIDGADYAEKSKTAITEDLISFLKNELHLPESHDKQIFFVSAEDMYTKRKIKERNAGITYGYDERCRQFEEFENTLLQFINALNENKLNHYKEELNNTRKTIIDYSEKFKTEFIKTNYFKNILVEWPNYKCELHESLNRNINSIEKTHNDFKKRMKEFSDNCENLHRDSISSFEKDLDNLIQIGQIDFLKTEKNVIKYVDSENKKCKSLTSIAKEKGELNLKEILETDIQLTKIYDTPWEIFCRKFTNICKFLKKNFKQALKDKDSGILNENIKKIKSNIAEFDSNGSEFFKDLSEYLQKEINGIINELDHKIKIYAEYLTNIENLFQLKIKC